MRRPYSKLAIINFWVGHFFDIRLAGRTLCSFRTKTSIITMSKTKVVVNLMVALRYRALLTLNK